MNKSMSVTFRSSGRTAIKEGFSEVKVEELLLFGKVGGGEWTVLGWTNSHGSWVMNGDSTYQTWDSMEVKA